MEIEKSVKCGYLVVPGSGFLKKVWNRRFYALFAASKCGIQRLEMFDNKQQHKQNVSPSKIIPLTDCVKVNTSLHKSQNNVFEIHTKEHLYLFSADSVEDMTDWLTNIQRVAFEFKTKTESTNVNQTEAVNSGISSLITSHHEENLIYCSVDSPEFYPVTVSQSDAATRCKLQGGYKLLVTSSGISLCNETAQDSKYPVIEWSYHHIRRYGYNNTTFSFEAGRKASSGEGLFTLNTKVGAVIFQSIATKVDSFMTFKNELSNSASAVDSKNSGVLSGNTEVKMVAPITPSMANPADNEYSVPSRICSNVYDDPELVVEEREEGVYDVPENEHVSKPIKKGKKTAQELAEPTYDALNFSSEESDDFPIADEISRSWENKIMKGSSPQNKNATDLYGKIRVSRRTSASDSTDYENSVSANDQARKDYVSDSANQSPKHVICNDVVYAQIVRKKK